MLEVVIELENKKLACDDVKQGLKISQNKRFSYPIIKLARNFSSSQGNSTESKNLRLSRHFISLKDNSAVVYKAKCLSIIELNRNIIYEKRKNPLN